MYKLLLMAAFIFVSSGSTTLASLILAQEEDAKKKSDKTAKKSPRENLDTAIADMIRLLDAKEYEKFIDLYIHPEMVKTALADMTKKELVKRVSEHEKTKVCHKYLKAIHAGSAKLVKPKADEEDDDDVKNTRVYKLDKPIKGSSRFAFMKIGKHWYFVDA